MITVHIIGGLGNQFFQYAAGRRLALRLGTGLCLNFDGFGRPAAGIDGTLYPRPFELAKFAISPVTIADAAAEHEMRRRSEAAWNMPPQMRVPLAKFYFERPGTFNEELLDLPDGVYLHGYFQCERYFADIAHIIRREFQPRDPASAARVKETLAGLRRRGRRLVALHVRRGDYLVPRPEGSLLMPIEKIRWAMAQFANADFMVFSDDLPWCREHIRGGEIRYSPFQTAVDDMSAMKQCDDYIIANSSFSWWGAWLNPNPQKIVYAPSNWWVPGAGGAGTMPDIVPEDWIKF